MLIKIYLFVEQVFSGLKKPNKTGLRICIALCIYTGRTLNLVNISYFLVSCTRQNIRSQ